MSVATGLCEFLDRFDNDSVAYPIGLDGEAMALSGHWIWCRKCEREDHRFADDAGNELVIHLPEKSKDVGNWVEIKAIGPEVSQRRDLSKTKAAMKGLSKCMHINSELKVGDVIMVADFHPWGMKWGIYDKSEGMIDESLVLAKWEN